MQSKGLSRVFSNRSAPAVTGHAEAWPRGATPHLRPGAVAGRSSPTFKEQWLRQHRRAERSYSMFKVRRGGLEEIPLIQGKEQQLSFAGAAMKKYPMSR